MQQSGNEGGFAAVRMTGERNVANVCVGVALHPHLLRYQIDEAQVRCQVTEQRDWALPTATEGLSSTRTF